MKRTNKLYTQTELANKIGVSKGTLSKWLNKNNVSPEIEKGNKKLYKETIIKEYKQAKKADKEEKTVVQVGNRVVTDAVTTQKKANGYSFTG